MRHLPLILGLAGCVACGGRVEIDEPRVPDTMSQGGGAPVGPQMFVPPPDFTESSEATSHGLNARHDNLQPNDSVASPLHKAWAVTFEAAVGYPLVAHGRVYVVTRGTTLPSQTRLRALSVDGGAPLWGPIELADGPLDFAYDRERLFTVDSAGNLSAHDASTGGFEWTAALPGQSTFTSGPVAVGGTVYVNGAGLGGTTYAVDETSGRILWQTNTAEGSNGSVAVLGTRVYEAEACQHLSAFESTSGQRAWFHHGDCVGGGGVTPSIYGNWIWEIDRSEGNIVLDLAGNAHGAFIANQAVAFDQALVFYQQNNVLSAIDIASGAQRWTFQPPTAGSGGNQLCFGPVVAGKNHRAYAALGTSQIIELDAATGSTISADYAALGNSGCAAGLVVAEGHLFVPLGSELIAY